MRIQRRRLIAVRKTKMLCMKNQTLRNARSSACKPYGITLNTSRGGEQERLQSRARRKARRRGTALDPTMSTTAHQRFAAPYRVDLTCREAPMKGLVWATEAILNLEESLKREVDGRMCELIW